MESSLLVKKEGPTVILTLNRPDKLNALNREMFESLAEAMDIIETDKSCRAVILTAQGDKAFCVGADLKERQGMNEKDVLTRFEWVHQLFTRLENLRTPVIAAVGGLALGGGTELTLACDIRIASTAAVFGFPEVELAIIPGAGGTQRLPRLIGVAKALELILLARRLTAKEALHFGLVSTVVAPDQLLAEAISIAKRLVNFGPLGLAQAKKAIRQGIEKPMEQALRFETEAYKVCLYSKDRLEGLKAFSEKRRPNYIGE